MSDSPVLVPSADVLAAAVAADPPPPDALALSLAGPVHALTGATRWLYRAVGAVAAFFTTPEYDATKVTDAIDKLQSTLDFLDRKVVAMTDRVTRYALAAKRLYACKNVPGAVHQLRLKKMYEREVTKMEALKFNLESNILHMESVGVMMETVATIKETSHQFQVVSKHVDIARLEGSIEEMFEQRDTSRDIESILNEMHDAHEYNDDELMRELEAGVDEERAGDTPVADEEDHRSPSASGGGVLVDAPGTTATAPPVFPEVPSEPVVPKVTARTAVALT